MMDALKSQGFFATKTSDRFKAGRPDLRIAHRKTGQLDVELKFATHPLEKLWAPVNYPRIVDTGIRKLQELKIKEMNLHGIPAIGLVYVECLGVFRVTNFLRDTLSGPGYYVKKGDHKGNVIDGYELMEAAAKYLKGRYD